MQIDMVGMLRNQFYSIIRSMTDADSDAAIESFIRRWSPSGGSERVNHQLFLTELCDVLGVERPEPSVDDNTALPVH